MNGLRREGTSQILRQTAKTIYYSKAFIDTQTLRQVEVLLCHEVLHGALHHATRRDWRDKDIWNQSADYMVNALLKDSQMELPDGALINPDYNDKSAEQLYAILEKQAQKQPRSGGGKGQGKGKQPPGGGQQPGSVFDSNDSAAERSHQEQEWNVAVQQAAQAAKQAGNLPASLERFIEESKKSQINWVEVLHRFFEETNPVEMTWFPSNRRYVAAGEFLPSYVREGTAEIAVAVDTSGSVDPSLLGAQFVAEINCIFD